MDTNGRIMDWLGINQGILSFDQKLLEDQNLSHQGLAAAGWERVNQVPAGLQCLQTEAVVLPTSAHMGIQVSFVLIGMPMVTD